MRRVRAFLVILLVGPGGLPAAAQLDETVERLRPHVRWQLPSGDGPFPAVLWASGCSGFEHPMAPTHYDDRVGELVRLGFAVMYVDYVSARGVESACNGVMRSIEVDDYVKAAIVLARNEAGIDSESLHLMGSSLGGAGVLAALSRLEPELRRSLQSAILLYPDCDGLVPWDSDLPSLFLLGGADELTPAAECRVLASSWEREGSARVVLYPNAHHAFDMKGLPEEIDPDLRPLAFHPKAARAAWDEVAAFLEPWQRPERALLDAISEGDADRVAMILKVPFDVDVEDAEGRTALVLATLRDDEAMVSALLKAGADPEVRDARGNTPLLLSVTRDPAVVRALIEGGADVDAANDEGETPLLAAAQGHTESVRLLLDASADVSHRDDIGLTALTVAEAAGASDIVQALREAGAEGDPVDDLHAAIRAGERERVTALLEEGVDVDGLDPDKYQTPLMTALEHGRLEILLLLTQAGANPSKEGTGIETSGENAITLASRLGSPFALRALLERGARSEDLPRALFLGCADANVVRVIIEKGGDVNVKDEAGRTPLMCAAAGGSVEAVTALLEAGADAEAASNDGRTARDWAESAGHEDVLALLP